ncbi:MAG: 4-oxalocrotonate tautomerase family protein [Nitrospiraceae bacterium]
MLIVTIQLTDGSVTQEQKNALVARSTAMVKEVLHLDPRTTGVLIEETGVASWGARQNPVTHRFRNPREYERCLITRWHRKKT